MALVWKKWFIHYYCSKAFIKSRDNIIKWNRRCVNATALKRNHKISTHLQWRHNEHDRISNHQPHDCLLNRWKKTSKLRVTGLCAGNSPLTGEFPAQRASNVENVSIWWRQHDVYLYDCALFWVGTGRVTHIHQGDWHGGKITLPQGHWSNPGSLLTNETLFYWYRDACYKPETVIRPSKVYNEDFYIGKTRPF